MTVVETDVQSKLEKNACELCGSNEGKVLTWCGGYLTYAHEKCAKIANIGVKLYIRYLLYDMWGLKQLARDILGVAKLDEQKQKMEKFKSEQAS